jgi:hypothetical protein
MRVAISTADSDRIGANIRQCSVFSGRGRLADIALPSRAGRQGQPFSPRIKAFAVVPHKSTLSGNPASPAIVAMALTPVPLVDGAMSGGKPNRRRL